MSAEPNLKPSRNGLCPCGSGRRYKLCCGRLDLARERHSHSERPAEQDAAAVELERLLGLMRAGEFAQLETAASAFLVSFPQAGLVWHLLGIASGKQGRDPLPALLEAVKYLPEDPTAHLNLGNALGRAGQLDQAAASYRRALSLRPDFAAAHNNLGDVLLELGQLAEASACFRRAVELQPELAVAHQNLGKTLWGLGQYTEALHSCERAVRLAPDSAEAHNSLGNAFSRLGRFDSAATCLRRALTLRPDFAEAHANLAAALRSTGQLDAALDSYRCALRLKPDFVSAYAGLASTLRLQQLTEQSESVCQEALRLAPESAAILVVLAELQADRGRFAEAQSYFTRAVASDPQSVEAWAGLARVRRMTRADEAWLRAVQGLLEPGLPPQREMILRYALGKYFDDVKDFAAAFASYRRANELARLCGPPHDQAATRAMVDSIIHAHDAAWLRARRGAAARAPRAVFVIGMLRSGTSLAEQILASHPQVFGAGELTYWSTVLADLLARPTELRVQQLRMSAVRLAGLRSGYEDQLQKLAPQAARVIDKLPTNFLALGLIHAALPEARIIHMQRNPIDTCLSIYCQHFEAVNTYTNDLEDLAHYYRQYQRLLEHWRAVLPRGTILDVPYEQLVAEPRAWTAKMLQFIDLPWDERCLQFHRTSRTVVTASKWQVRQAIDSSAVERWRNYASFLGPLQSLRP